MMDFPVVCRPQAESQLCQARPASEFIHKIARTLRQISAFVTRYSFDIPRFAAVLLAAPGLTDQEVIWFSEAGSIPDQKK